MFRMNLDKIKFVGPRNTPLDGMKPLDEATFDEICREVDKDCLYEIVCFRRIEGVLEFVSYIGGCPGGYFLFRGRENLGVVYPSFE